ncbi:tRNA preQ1(34) S-adenosylmethionine ribosyltransferase-isomerase QueA [Meiothermus sp. QL-1]|uniref:tRNA preQ1(34) S-adenosylmethionine ribosyltransferase-isomerase QueA n=1 Tax=Meiothermus sp. QL-1 TaxID=2058095 RepID=UPI000E0AC92D|nr:tRNA preQ1(34) S-adenosylmethionine ribosyltransferase-isomerase QueA [Meiothermus sp. QL-1]RDI96384.1 tRNA preQ1(34) S-adenosylmethionine ribosyltransferase-isomerase QueA [Meiothermus sp. QL-1]
MRLEDFDYHLPPELIAQQGAEPRDAARLMVVERQSGRIEHRVFRELPHYLRPGDVLVLNESKVIPARTFAQNPQGTPIEVLLVRELPGGDGRWEALLRPARRARVGTRLTFPEGLCATVEAVQADGSRLLRFEGDIWAHLERIGQTPLPPYIRAPVEPTRYQTVYARTPGSVAAPTAGLHFTPELLACLQAMGVEISYLILHVGPGTFKPVKESPETHVMHREPYEIPPSTAAAVNQAKAQGRRVIAVGTTVVRALETAWSETGLQPGAGETQLFIRPGFHYRVVDALITNFHLPRSTLLMLVSAFMGHELMRRAYQTAVAERYRFYSLGDAMLIL